MPEVYTIGYGNRKKEEFVGLLRRFRIDLVADVRRFPTSKREEFRKENLERILKTQGIGYLHIAELGGYRGGYQEYTRTKSFELGLNRLVEVAREKTTAIMCLEENPRWCHRRYIASALRRKGWRVLHILRKGEVRASVPARRRLPPHPAPAC